MSTPAKELRAEVRSLLKTIRDDQIVWDQDDPVSAIETKYGAVLPGRAGAEIAARVRDREVELVMNDLLKFLDVPVRAEWYAAEECASCGFAPRTGKILVTDVEYYTGKLSCCRVCCGNLTPSVIASRGGSAPGVSVIAQIIGCCTNQILEELDRDRPPRPDAEILYEMLAKARLRRGYSSAKRRPRSAYVYTAGYRVIFQFAEDGSLADVQVTKDLR